MPRNHPTTPETLGFESHDHRNCIAGSVGAAERHCAQAGVQLTPIRRRVLEILLERHQAMGAYDILDQLREEGLRSQPPVAYRALDFLVQHGFAHKIERLNAFTACALPGQDHAPVFLVCRLCRAVAETVTHGQGVSEAAEIAGFEVERVVVEAEGICPNCRPEASA
ncbi:Fur family transcriptional regulator, zinc uptake regulator [Poseidonocella pacifica]|uniref:Fur family transcriptional regulator, zinc uptake regulator n=1 Tax=Poseidonocella pacifica TaxID=871651 RepID=A0A1I0WRC9_9RHOB|nr:Fur family transcriptional regulator, zinc uptake regulator [Poseidonocella pacifica]